LASVDLLLRVENYPRKQVFSHHESEKEQIEIACRALDGQAIESIDVDLNTVNTKFCFDLGGCLETGPYDDKLNTQWYLYCPNGNVFTFRSDGHYSFQSGDTTENNEKWIKLSKTEQMR
jgi:hypothetical protein